MQLKQTLGIDRSLSLLVYTLQIFYRSHLGWWEEGRGGGLLSASSCRFEARRFSLPQKESGDVQKKKKKRGGNLQAEKCFRSSASLHTSTSLFASHLRHHLSFPPPIYGGGKKANEVEFKLLEFTVSSLSLSSFAHLVTASDLSAWKNKRKKVVS